MDHTEKKTASQYSDQEDSLSSYMHMLETCNVISPEEEQKLWAQLDDIRNQIRTLIYQFGFVISEHIKEIDILDEKNIIEIFPYSVFPSESSDLTHNQHTILMKLRKWTDVLKELQIKQRNAYESGNRKEFESIREESVQEMMRYPVLYEKIKEWEKVAAVYAQGSTDNPDKLREFEYKLMMNSDEYNVLKEKINALLTKNSRISEQILTANLRLVVSIIKKYQVKRDFLSDLISEGNIGMIYALDRFDTKRGNRFATYASWWIKRQIGQAIAGQFRVIRLPRRMLETIQDINRAEQNLILVNGKEPSVEELAAYLEQPVARIRAIKRMASQPIYLQDSANGPNGVSDLENILESNDDSDPAKMLLRKQMQERIKAGLSSMPERWQQIIRMHYGFDFQQPKSYEEIGALLGISRQRVCQIEKQALSALRKNFLDEFTNDMY